MKCAKLAAVLYVSLGSIWGQAPVPTPESVLGHKPGDDFYLASYDESLGYFQKLARGHRQAQAGQGGQDHPRPRLVHRHHLLGAATWPTSINTRTPRSGWRWSRASPTTRRTTLARNGKVIVHIDGGLHATEVAPAQHDHPARLQPGDRQATRIPPPSSTTSSCCCGSPSIPTARTGGHVVSQQSGHAVRSQPTCRGLFQEYIGHDNNRDGYMNNMIESQVITRADLEYYPGGVLRPPPDRALPGAHLDSAVRRSGVAQSAPADVPLGERVRHRHGGLPGRARHARRDAPRPLRRLVSRLRRPRQQLPQYGFVPHRDGALPLRHAALLHDRGFSARQAAICAAEVFYSSPWHGGWWRLGDAVRYNVGALDGGAGYRRQESRRTALRPLPRGPRRGRALHQGSALCLRDSARAARHADRGDCWWRSC